MQEEALGKNVAIVVQLSIDRSRQTNGFPIIGMLKVSMQTIRPLHFHWTGFGSQQQANGIGKPGDARIPSLDLQGRGGTGALWSTQSAAKAVQSEFVTCRIVDTVDQRDLPAQVRAFEC